jgi:hypothetical protein
MPWTFLCHNAHMKKTTGPIDGLRLIRRAVTFGNMADVSDVAAVCRRLKVLPPGAPYVINPRGDVFAVARRKKGSSKSVAQAHTTMRECLARVTRGIAPAGSGLAWTGDLMRDGKIDLGQLRELKKRVDLLPPSARWFRVQGYQRRRIVEDDTLIVPTLDGLVAASAPVLWEYRDHIRKCPCCERYWIRGEKKASDCGKPSCRLWRIRRNKKKASKKKRAKDREARSSLRGAK